MLFAYPSATMLRPIMSDAAQVISSLVGGGGAGTRPKAPDPEKQQPSQQQRPMIEDFRLGYPQFSALIASADQFFVFRRFRRLRARLQLLKQDEITILEQRLDQLDKDEPNDLFLGSRRHDTNAQRKALLAEIEQKLVEYGMFDPGDVVRSVDKLTEDFTDRFTDMTANALRHSVPEPRDVQSVRNWLEAKAAISRAEEAYVYHDKDLFALAPGADSALLKFEDWVLRRLNQIPGFRDVSEVPRH